MPARAVLGPSWWPLLDALRDAEDDAATLAALERQLAPRWQLLIERQTRARSSGERGGEPSLRQLGRHWVERVALQAHQWRRTVGARQVERRIRAHTGRSLRQWESLARTEGVFFAARERVESGRSLDWASIALEEGFADQSHMNRAVKRTIGFTPSEFAQRYAEDESFWAYRLWV